MGFEPELAEYLAGPAALEARIARLGDADLVRRPDYEGAWSAKEHVIHLVDSEANGFLRLKSIIAQPGSECYVMDEEAWTRNLRGVDEDLRKYLSLFGLLRSLAGDILRGQREDDPRYFVRTYQGQTTKITMRDWLGLYVRHLAFHTEYIDRIVKGMGPA